MNLPALAEIERFFLAEEEGGGRRAGRAVLHY